MEAMHRNIALANLAKLQSLDQEQLMAALLAALQKLYGGDEDRISNHIGQYRPLTAQLNGPTTPLQAP